MGYKTTDALMRHLRKSGIAIKGGKQKRQLIIGLPYVNFKTIGDYIILMCYYMKLLKVSKTEIKAFIREFEKITDNYISMVNANVSAIVVHPDLKGRMSILKNFL